MEIKPVRSATDHRRALKEIEGIFDAAAGTPDGDRLEVLATLVEVYEAAHHQIEPPNPIEAILYHLESRGLALPLPGLSPALGSDRQRERSSRTVVDQQAMPEHVPADQEEQSLSLKCCPHRPRSIDGHGKNHDFDLERRDVLPGVAFLV